MANVSSVTTGFFPAAQEGFTTTTSGTVASGAATVGLNSVSGYTNGDPVAFVIEPLDASKKQAFTGIIDTSGVQVTGVEWTEGTNQSHSAGVTVVDYETATAWMLQKKGFEVVHNQDGTLKDSIVAESKIASGAVTTGKLADAAVTAEKTNFSTFTDYTPTVTGFSVVPPGATYRYFLLGKLCILTFRQPNAGTSNSTQLTITAPFVSANIPGHAWEVYIDNYVNNGTTSAAGIASINANSNVIIFYRDPLGLGWTASGAKRINAFQIIYEIA